MTTAMAIVVGASIIAATAGLIYHDYQELRRCEAIWANFDLKVWKRVDDPPRVTERAFANLEDYVGVTLETCKR